MAAEPEAALDLHTDPKRFIRGDFLLDGHLPAGSSGLAEPKVAVDDIAPYIGAVR